MVFNSSHSTPKHDTGQGWASHWAPSQFSSKMRMFSSKVWVELVLKAAQKASQDPQDSQSGGLWWKTKPCNCCVLLDGNRRKWGHSTRRAESLLGRARGRDCERKQGLMWFRLRYNALYQERQFSLPTDGWGKRGSHSGIKSICQNGTVASSRGWMAFCGPVQILFHIFFYRS